MKVYAAITLCLCLCLLWTGCTPAAPAEPYQSPSVTITEVSENATAEDGTVIFVKAYPQIEFTGGRENMAQRVKSDLKKCVDTALAEANIIEQQAREDYTGQTDWTIYFVSLKGSSMRLDERVFSVYFEFSSFSGGNHPSAALQSVTYDLCDGSVLTLEDILADGYSVSRLSIPVNAALAASYDTLFDDYEAIVAEHFSTGDVENWYFSDDGLCFHFAPYDVGPYSIGTVIATIEYSQLEGIVKSEFLPA